MDCTTNRHSIHFICFETNGGGGVYTLNFIKDERTIQEALFQVITTHDISIVACGDLVVNYKEVNVIIETAKSIKPDIVTIIGGGLVTYSPVEAMTIIPSADYGIIGEGEITICELVDAIERKTAVSEIDGIIYRYNDSKLVVTNERAEAPDLDALPFPDYEEFLGDFIKDSLCASIVTSRSCPFKCTYCSHSGGKSFRTRSMDSIFSEIDFLVEEYSINSLFLNDELFAVQPARIIEFCNRIMDYELQWFISLRISSSLTLEILTLMKKAGCERILYGLESADDRILRSMKKGITVPLIESVLTLTKEAGINVHGAFIFGDPEETVDSVSNTIQWINNHRNLLGSATLGPIILYPGSALYNNAVKNEIIDPVKHILNGCPHVNVSKLTDEYFSNLISEVFPVENAKIDGNISHSNIMISISAKDEKTCYDITATCPNCATQYSVSVKAHELSTVRPLAYVCSVCKYKEALSVLPSYVSYVDDKLSELIKDRKCAVWPTSSHFNAVYQHSKVMKLHIDDYELINSSIGSSNLLYGKEIRAPEFLNNNKVDTVIIFSVHYADIAKEIRMKYSHVEPIAFHDIGFILGESYEQD